MARRALRDVMPAEVPETSPATPSTPPKQTPEMQDLHPRHWQYVVIHGHPVTRKEFDEAKRSGGVLATRSFGFILKDADDTLWCYFFYQKDNTYYRGIYTYDVSDFDRPVARFDVQLVLTDDAAL